MRWNLLSILKSFNKDIFDQRKNLRSLLNNNIMNTGFLFLYGSKIFSKKQFCVDTGYILQTKRIAKCIFLQKLWFSKQISKDFSKFVRKTLATTQFYDKGISRKKYLYFWVLLPWIFDYNSEISCSIIS